MVFETVIKQMTPPLILDKYIYLVSLCYFPLKFSLFNTVQQNEYVISKQY